MFRNIRTLAALVIGFAGIAFSGQTAQAQQYPGNGLADIAAANWAFDQQFDVSARYWSKVVAANMRPGEVLPFNAMTISASTSAGMRQFESNAAAWHVNSNAQMNAVSNYSVGAIQGNWYYGNGNGQTYVMPYNYNSYYQQNGYMYGGYQQAGNNYYLMNRR